MPYDRRVTVTGDLLVWNARLIDGRGGTPRERVAIDVRGGLIEAITDIDGASTTPDGALDVGGRTVLPGLIDAHDHVLSDLERSPGFGPPPPLHGEEPRPGELRWFVLAKVARALLARRASRPSATSAATTTRRSSCARRSELGPRRGSADPVVRPDRLGDGARARRIFGTMYREADGPWEMRQAVREQIRRGADYIKVMATGARPSSARTRSRAQMTREEIDAVVDEAHRMGFRVAAHAEGLDGARMAIEAGVDTIEHGLSASIARPSSSTDGRARHRPRPDAVDVPRPRRAVRAPTSRRARRPGRSASATRPYADAPCGARAPGVILAMGYDSGPPGASANELVRMVEAGLTPSEAIVAATAGSARRSGWTDRGTVEAGKVADLLVVDGDPLGEPGLLLRPGIGSGSSPGPASRWRVRALQSRL